MDITSEITYNREHKNTLYTSGEYLVLAHSLPYERVKEITGISETILDSGTGTIFKKEFRYSIDSASFSEFQEITTSSLTSLGSFDKIWFQFRYILLSGGPVTISKVEILFTEDTSINYENYEQPNPANEDHVYAFPIIYRSNFVWEPYKLNRAIRLYKDLNLMVNSMFGHDVVYYKLLAQGRSKDVFLMEYSLFEHEEGTCLKVVVPENAFPDNKLNMGPFGVDFDVPFEVQIDKDYYQKIFGQGSGPQKGDVIYFQRTDRIYTIMSSYLFRDFMNEPLYFKISLVKWMPKSNAEQSETLNKLEDFTVGVDKLFGDLIEEEQIKITNPQQFEVAYKSDDPTRRYLYEKIFIATEKLDNYYTVIAEHFYKMESSLNDKIILTNVDTNSVQLTVGNTYYVRTIHDGSSHTDHDLYYSIKKLKFLGLDNEMPDKAIFEYYPGKSSYESTVSVNSIFRPDSPYGLYSQEHHNLDDDITGYCTIDYCTFHADRIVEYKTKNEFTANTDLSYSAWFKVKDSTFSKIKLTDITFDDLNDNHIINVYLEKNELYFIGDTIKLSKISGGNFFITGTVVQVGIPEFDQDNTEGAYKIHLDIEQINYVTSNFSTWKTYTDFQIQKIMPRNFIKGFNNDKGISIDLIENKHVKITMNDSYKYFSIPNSSAIIENDVWYAIFVNFSNTFKQLTVNIWKRQWDPVSKFPATTELELVFNKMINIEKVDRSVDRFWKIDPSFMDLTNIRLYNRTAETDKQSLMLNQNVVKDAQWAIVIDNSLPQSNMPYISYTH